MTIKYIITQINDNIIYSKYNNNGCLSLNIVDKSSLVGNIYIGRVENVLLGMQAAFVNIGEDKNTFIHIRDIIPKVSNETGNKNEELSKHNIKNYVRVGMPILVQVNRAGFKIR